MIVVPESVHIVAALLHRDIKVMVRFLLDDIIDSMILVGFVYLMYAKLLPLMGVSTALVTPAFVGIVVIAMINVAYDRAIKDAFDFENTRFIDYQIMLPLPIRWLVVKYMISYAIDIFLASFPVMLMGTALFWRFLDFTHANFFLFFLLYFLSITLIGSLLLLVIVARSFHWLVENAWPRIFLPMISLGALYYPWQPVTRYVPLLSKIMLLLPTVHIVEGLRSALTGNPLYRGAWGCCVAVAFFMVMVTFLLMRAMQKRVDPL